MTDLGPSSHMACPACHGGEFLLLPGGRIVCADEECGRPYGIWYSPDDLRASVLGGVQGG